MGAWKPQRQTRRAFHSAMSNRTRAGTEALLGKTGKPVVFTANPPDRVPTSAIIVEMMRPLMGELPHPASKKRLAALAAVCAAAWNASRLERGDEADQKLAEKTAEAVGGIDADLTLVFDGLRAFARQLYPDDTRLIAKTTVDIRDDELRVNATSIGRGA